MARSKRVGKIHPKSKVVIYSDGTCDARVGYSVAGYKIYYGKRGRGIGVYLLHRHVAELFVPNPFKKPLVNHKDGKKYNAKASNLEWVSHAENSAHAVRIGLTRRKLTAEMVRSIRKSKLPASRICYKYNVSEKTIGHVRMRITWKHIK